MIPTMLDMLKTRAERICVDGINLIEECSGLLPIETHIDSVEIINMNGNHYWNTLSTNGKRIQTALLPEVKKFIQLVLTLSNRLPKAAQREIRKALGKILNTIEQSGATWWKTKDDAAEGFKKLIDKVITTLEDHYGTPTNDVLVIPDTNALLHNTDIESWAFDGIKHFTIILTPTILAELDAQKINHRNEGVRNKAKTLINKFKEYQRRGSLLEGVTITNNRISMRSIASEPNMRQALPWFDPSNDDDRFLASTIEIIRSNLGAIVFIVTLDINMQNKAEMAAIPFYEPPEKVLNNTITD